METHDWSKFCKRINVDANIQSIYNAWTTQFGLEKWFLRKAEFTNSDQKIRDKHSNIQKGDRYEWLWYGYGDEVVEKKEIIEANGKDFLQFGFAGDCVVSVQIKVEEGESIVELWQENIPVDENPKTNLLVGCGEGWTFYLANLKSILEGGIDLRNKSEKLKGVINS